MKRTMLWGTVGAAAVAAGAGLLVGPKPAALAATHTGRSPVVVELFTSEGCSDCPPADALATRLQETQPVPGAQVIVLGEHVDYWNSARWADRFSQHTFSERQSDYVNHLHLDSPYTPEVVVDGRTDALGNDPGVVERAIAEDARAPKANVRLSRAGDGLQVHISEVPVAGAGDVDDVVLAVTEDGLSSRVGGGENTGRFLKHSAVVRSLRVIGSVRGTSPAGFDATVPVGVAPGWRRSNLRAVVFLQSRASRRIIGASAIDLR